MNPKKIIIVAGVMVLVVVGIIWLTTRGDRRNESPSTLINISSSAVSGVGPQSITPPPSMPDEQTVSLQQTKNYMHEIILKTNFGDITFETFDKDAPRTVQNFITLAEKKFYNNLTFHRVISGFMIQGGDPNGNGTGGPGYTFNDELKSDSESAQLGYQRGIVAMANAGPNTNGSQFFIMHQKVSLPYNYTIFGMVTRGIETVDAIAKSKTDSADKPLSSVFIKEISVITK